MRDLSQPSARLQFAKLAEFASGLGRDRFLRNMGWVGLAEAMTRVTRLVTAVALARMLDPTDYGLAAIAITTNEIVRVLTNTGIGQRIIRAEPDDLDAVCHRAWWLQWVWCGALFLGQSLIGVAVAVWYDAPSLAWMISAMALVYLVMPLGLTQCFLVMRENRLKVIALVAGSQVSADNLLTAALAVAGLGAWAVILPKILVAPVWVVAMRRAHPWRRDPDVPLAPVRGFLTFGRSILGVEALKTIRLHADKLIIGSYLGIELLGMYAFAFSAGLGLSLAFVGALNVVLFPYLAEAGRDPGVMVSRWRRALLLAVLVAGPVVTAQALLAPWYVPIVFGERWSEAIPILTLLCLSALTRPLADGAGQLLRAMDHPHLELRWNVMFTVAFLGALMIGLTGGLLGVALAILVVHLALEPLFMVWVWIRATRHRDRTARVDQAPLQECAS
ncbi:oligosaccharide flippase family protein [Roseospira visakhapatnamensis]|uniref:PST family polysaccharide transporter n=1 Tax=Roseospira visakhapatnamensis TaxID=390880 RepID=A0A7W6RBC5_9PROT|nr:oligosaccharide flippase family protein [Roseospira visakhapatnamensis]MBB4265290.1 PST family polysaccharide transporter [Roseospira visakhapatnamensis]